MSEDRLGAPEIENFIEKIKAIIIIKGNIFLGFISSPLGYMFDVEFIIKQ